MYPTRGVLSLSLPRLLFLHPLVLQAHVSAACLMSVTSRVLSVGCGRICEARASRAARWRAHDQRPSKAGLVAPTQVVAAPSGSERSPATLVEMVAGELLTFH